MSNILERHLEENIEPNQSKQSYIDQAIQIFQDMKEEDITTCAVSFKEGNQYCLNGLIAFMYGYGNSNVQAGNYARKLLGDHTRDGLTHIHIEYCHGRYGFEEMRQKAIQYMESLK